MKYLVNAREMQRCDRITIEEYGIPGLVLMERAALAVADSLMDGTFCMDKVLVVCGSGNNGGDGFAVARILMERNVEIAVLFAGKEESMSEAARIQKKICENYGMNFVSNIDIHEYTCIVDAIFGVGLSRKIEGRYQALIEQINQAPGKVAAVDIPSGISADSGRVMGTAVCADRTVTFGFAKLGQVLYPGAAYCGETAVWDIGITEKSFRGEFPCAYYLEREDMCRLPQRMRYSNKGTYGKALLAAGQKNMCGAACLAGEAAYRMGTGLVKIFTEECNRVIVQARLPEALLSAYEPQDVLEEESIFQWPTAAGIGPGFGTGTGKWEILCLFLEKCICPLVLDADALNLLSGRTEKLRECRSSVVVTPHIGEMERLTGIPKKTIQEDLPGTCRQFAEEYGVVCVLKDTRTVISDGREICVNLTGTDGMATGGSGDVLTGILTGLLAQGMETFAAAKLAVWIHGAAGELAAERLGKRGMLAGDILQEIPTVLLEGENA
ncbi:NAD(P)H-hydrate dehydratase [Lachnospiraceae bacterium 46-15]